ncbi:TetR/AcrR family transcriptional regulator [Tsukamurella sp. 8F]|uniref:TetR/AcrR family transcriptional regulator n=1 Tax=unclassified Tsukamurella TaxID=2633480 RepID=UPI0023BA185D|nr:MULTISPECIES: TetR/AcrR family transcriptional regulator [unclassified Tsukamurella]MDF0528425.1 TetR/AcrR family transcriptional regulator [Tsukamurella sp. 8J]MDF0586250.1 TetR/AcrR family transcriptional regulator [Tsukamurella sp. 8F]
MAYHHGDLPAALIAAGLEVTRKGGPQALTLRELTRRAGVTPNAAYRHFPDRKSLVAAVSGAIQQRMAESMTALFSEDHQPVERLRAVGMGYIRFALSEPGWFSVAFFGAGIPKQPSLDEALPYVALTTVLDDMVQSGDLAPERRPEAPWACWSAVHGFAELALHGPLQDADEEAVERAAQATVDAAIEGIRARA